MEQSIRLLGEQLYQWDLGRQVELRGAEAQELHYAAAGDDAALIVTPSVLAGVTVAEIPNILLQQEKPIMVYAVITDGETTKTICETVLPILPRPKPADYVYTETEVQSYRALESRLAALEAGGGSGGGGEVWETIADVTLEEQVSSFSIDQDMNGEAFLLRKYWLAYTWAQVTDGSEISNAWFLVENGRQFEDGQPPLYTSAFEPASASGKKSGYIVAELLPNNVLWEQNYRCNADSFVILEPFSPLNAPVTNVLKYTVMKQRDAYEPFYQIGGNNLSIPVGSRIMLWGVRA